MLALTARRVPRTLQRTQQQLRSVHIENKVGENFPFTYRDANGRVTPAFKYKFLAFSTVGFALPFIASGYQLGWFSKE